MNPGRMSKIFSGESGEMREEAPGRLSRGFFCIGDAWRPDRRTVFYLRRLPNLRTLFPSVFPRNRPFSTTTTPFLMT